MKEIKILLVEDNEGDVLLTIEALKDARVQNEVQVAIDGEQALTFLESGTCTPDLVLLDINLPRMDGFEVLAAIKNDDRWKMIPVIILTTSTSEKDILDSYSNHANCYITKPVDLGQFISVIRTIEDFWISIVKLPQHKCHEKTTRIEAA